jgi:hypothetical protein
MWLHENNPIYNNINVDRDWLEDLPEDNVPTELLSIMREGDKKDLLEREQGSYVNLDVNSEHTKVTNEDTGLENKSKLKKLKKITTEIKDD